MDKKNVFIRSLSYIEPVIALAMRKILFNAILFFFGVILNAQTVSELNHQVQRSQQNLQNASYSLVRKDTLVTAVDFWLTPDATYYYLRKTLPDIKKDEVMECQRFSPLLDEEIQINL